MGNAQKMGMAVGAIVIGLALGWLVFRHTFPASKPDVVATTQAVVAAPVAPAPPRARAPAPAAPKPTAHDDRLAEIDSELDELPDGDPQAITNLAQEVQSRRLEVQALREQLDQADRIYAANEQPPRAPDTHAFVAQQVAALQRQMLDAKERVRDQQTEIRWIAASNDTVRMNAMYAELHRREEVVNAIQQEINDLFDAEASQAASRAARERAVKAGVRNQRNALTAQYNDSVASLNAANAAYVKALQDLSEARKAGDALRAEKASLEK